MTAFFWPETTPTVMSDERGVTYINGAPAPTDAPSKVWVDRCKAKDEPVTIPHKLVADKDGTKAAVLTVAEFEARVKADDDAAKEAVAKETGKA